jgi:hypothetical protein
LAILAKDPLFGSTSNLAALEDGDGTKNVPGVPGAVTVGGGSDDCVKEGI